MNNEAEQHRGWLSWGLLPVMAGLLALLVALLALVLPLGGGEPTTLANLDPNDCDPTVGTATARIDASPSNPAVLPGDTITYTVGAAYSVVPGIACSAFNVNVHLRTPDGIWAPVCVLRADPLTLAEGESADCATTVVYTVTGSESAFPRLTGIVKVKGDKHDNAIDCVDSDKDDPLLTSICFGAEATTRLTSTPSTSTPTPTATATATATATSTATATATATSTATATATATSTATATATPTSTATATATPTSTATATATAASTATATATPTSTATATATATGSGCTPGYWKNHLLNWGPTGYVPGQDVDTVFTNANGGIGNASLLQALRFHGGNSLTGAKRILLRAGVAALLNAAHPGINYPISEGDVISQVNAALFFTDRSAILGLATTLDTSNNLGCTIDS